MKQLRISQYISLNILDHNTLDHLNILDLNTLEYRSEYTIRIQLCIPAHDTIIFCTLFPQCKTCLNRRKQFLVIPRVLTRIKMANRQTDKQNP